MQPRQPRSMLVDEAFAYRANDIGHLKGWHPGLDVGSSSTFDVSADGQRFVVVEDLESEEGASRLAKTWKHFSRSVLDAFHDWRSIGV